MTAANDYRPFCSERCRLIDLGDWLTEKHSIPADASPDYEPTTKPQVDGEGEANGNDRRGDARGRGGR